MDVEESDVENHIEQKHIIENAVVISSPVHSIDTSDISSHAMLNSAEKTPQKRSNGRPVKIARIDNGNLSDSYEAYILEEEEAIEIPGSRYWSLPITDIEGIKDVASLFVSIVGDPRTRSMLADDRSVKKKVWQKVAEKLSQLGYPVMHAKDEVEAGLKCNQKWKSLVRMYTLYNDHVSNGRKTSRSKPKFYDEVDIILKSIPRHGVTAKTAKRLRERLAPPIVRTITVHEREEEGEGEIERDGEREVEQEREAEAEASSEANIKYRLETNSTDTEGEGSSSDSSDSACNRNKRSKKFSLMDVIELMKQVRREDRRERRKDRKAREEEKRMRQFQFNQLIAKLEKENQLKQKMVDLFETFLQNTNPNNLPG